MYTIKALIPVIITIASVLKVDNIKFSRNLHDPLGITEPLTKYRISYNYSTTKIIDIKDSLNHIEIIKRGTFRNLETKEKDQENGHEVDNKNLQQKPNTNEDKPRDDIPDDNITENNKIEDKILETKKKDDKNNNKSREQTTNINLQHNEKFTENLQHNEKFTENLQHINKFTEKAPNINLQQNEKLTEAIHTPPNINLQQNKKTYRIYTHARG